MADTRVQLGIEDWIRCNWLPKKFNQEFRKEKLRLSSGGVFDFDAVSSDNSIVANISTSSGITSGGNIPSAKLQKLRADMFFLNMIKAKRKLIVLSEKDMYYLCLKEKSSGRVPKEIEFIHAKLPDDLAAILKKARKTASDEISINRRKLF